jgi:hypothetical protein
LSQTQGSEIALESKEYGAPQIVDYGDLVQLTAAAENGNFTDMAFPPGTPRGDITFSNNP